jgi:glycine/D-amino acid oxidase-like deaminating enzyme
MSNIPLWGETTHLELPTLRGRVATDVCVVGLGGSGLACVQQLVAAGKRVVALDASTVAAGAAGRNGGFLLGGLAMFHHDAVRQLGERRATAVYEQTLNQIDRMASETPSAVRRTGSLRIAASDDELGDCRRQLDAMRASGLPVDPYDGPEGRGLLFPRDCAFDPVRRCTLLARDAIARGARLYARSAAVSIASGHVATAEGEVAAEQVVVAIDGRLERVLPGLAGRVRSARLQMLGTAPAPEVSWPRPVYARWGLDYWQQLPDRRVVVGGFRDVGGEAEWSVDPEPTEAVQSALGALLRETLGVRAAITHRWAATVGYTPDGLPILDEVRPNVWAIGGYSGTGNVIGALCGRAVAEIIIQKHSLFADLLRG